MTFEQLQLIEPLLRALREKGYLQPTPIQVQSIPAALQGRDVLGCAQTGTGKTAAFALPILQRMWNVKHSRAQRQVLALVLAPTRELANQINDSFALYGKHSHLRSTVIYGGVAYPRQREALRRGVDIVVATPGRLLDLMNERSVRFDQLQVLVLDEADRMLDMGFLPDVKRILAALPRQRQTLFFSATLPPEIQRLVSSLLKDPLTVSVTPTATTVEKVEQMFFPVEGSCKPDFLAKLLSTAAVTRALVFTRTKRGADRVAQRLHKEGIRTEAIHGNKSQNARERALEGFRNGRTRVLVATDIAARGIDVKEISHVINYEMPGEPETYVHRIGRTARAECEGVAWSLCSRAEREHLVKIERLIRMRIPAGEGPRGADEPQRERRSAPARTGAAQHARRTAPARAPAPHARPAAAATGNGHAPAPREDFGAGLPTQGAAGGTSNGWSQRSSQGGQRPYEGQVRTSNRTGHRGPAQAQWQDRGQRPDRAYGQGQRHSQGNGQHAGPARPQGQRPGQKARQRPGKAQRQAARACSGSAPTARARA